MPLVINTNIGSLNAQRNLVKSGLEMSTAMERLSSGLRINTAADDAAGLALTNRMTSQIRGLDQAVRNANDGISMISTAEGALSETTNILQRMRELAVQSSNGIYSDADRATLDAEVQQLKSELDRIANTTSFNGRNLLDGSIGEVKLQVGTEEGQTIDFTLEGFDTKSLGSATGGDIVGTASSGGAFAGTLTVNGVLISNADLLAANTTEKFIDLVNSRVSSVEIDAFTEVVASADGDGVITSAQSLNLSVVDEQGKNQTFQVSNTSNMQELADKITEVSGGLIEGGINSDGRLTMNADSGLAITVTYTGATAANTGVTAATYQESYTLSSTDGSAIKIDYGTAADALVLGIDERLDNDGGDITGYVAGATTALSAGDLTINGVTIDEAASAATVAANIALINKFSDETGVVASGTTVITLNSVDGSEIELNYKDGSEAAITTIMGIQETNVASVAGRSVYSLDISTQAKASKAIDVIDGALETVNNQRSKMGAIVNRLDFTVSNLMNVSENTSAARSRILDADFAQETANLSRTQVLQQATSAMLAQANAAPQLVLSLLR